MDLSYFDYELPASLIAQNPVNPRRASRLLVSQNLEIIDARFEALPTFLNSGDLLVVNNTKVFPALLIGQKKKGRDSDPNRIPGPRISINLDTQNQKGNWSCLGKPLKKLRIGDTIQFGVRLEGEVIEIDGKWCEIAFNLQGKKFFKEVHAVGHTPLPGYIFTKRPETSADQLNYQSFFAQEVGAVAAPTAALHFDEQIVAKIKARGIRFTELTLHVGAGTFLPMSSENINEHEIHGEWGKISQTAVNEILLAKKNKNRVIAVGTTSLRLMETAAKEGKFSSWEGMTDLYITPGFDFRVADGLLTNFHLPKSSLLVLVAAFVGGEKMRQIYRHAVNEQYRFLSYGDSSLLLKSP